MDCEAVEGQRDGVMLRKQQIDRLIDTERGGGGDEVTDMQMERDTAEGGDTGMTNEHRDGEACGCRLGGGGRVETNRWMKSVF